MQSIAIVLVTVLHIKLIQNVDAALKQKTFQNSFVSVPIFLRECEKPSKPYEKVRTMLVKAELINDPPDMYIKGNLTITHDQYMSENMKLQGRIFRQEGDQWTLIKMLNTNACRGFVARTISIPFGVNFEQNRCKASKGLIRFDKVNLNKVLNILWPTNREYGYYLFVFEIQDAKTVKVCFEYQVLLKPGKSKDQNN